MKTLDDFFHTSGDIVVHPRLRNWRQRLDKPGVTAKVELNRPQTALGIAQTEMTLFFSDNTTSQPTETIAWDDDLNRTLIQWSVRSISTDQEVQRFSLGLRGALRKAEREFGDGYLNAVLIELITDSEFATHPEIADILIHCYALDPNREGRQYDLCREMVTDAISGRARELTGLLKYPETDAKRILVAALARYLDERFSVSSRRQLGML